MTTSLANPGFQKPLPPPLFFFCPLMILSSIKYPGECGGLNLTIHHFSVFFFFKEKIDGKFVSVPLSLFVQVFFFLNEICKRFFEPLDKKMPKSVDLKLKRTRTGMKLPGNLSLKSCPNLFRKAVGLWP